jgi:hypothetical protein
LIAEKINQRSGGAALVKPWEVDQVPEDFITAYDAFDIVRRRQRQYEQNEKYFREFRKRFKYRQY